MSIIPKAMANKSLWIWHCYFKFPNRNNDFKVFDKSSLLASQLREPKANLGFEEWQ